MFSPITNIRIVAPPHRVRERATVADTQTGDTIEITDLPIFRVDPKTRQATKELRRFVVGKNRALTLD